MADSPIFVAFCQLSHELDVHITIRGPRSGKAVWSAQYASVDLDKGGATLSEYGEGATLEAACLDYLRKMSGKAIVINLYQPDLTTRRVVFPVVLELGR